MAKPTDTISQIATDANFSNSPIPAVNGQPTKVALAIPAEGLIPGRAAGGANQNFLWNIANKFLQWVKDGTSTAATTAHIVETDSLGVINAAGIKIPNTALYLVGLTVDNNNAGANAKAILATGRNLGVAVEGRQLTGSGSAVVGACAGTGGSGVEGSAEGAGLGGGLRGDGVGSNKAGVWAERTVDNDAPALLLSGDHASPVRGLLSIGEQSDEPSVTNNGDVYASNVDLRIAALARWNTIGYRPEGWIDAVAYYNDPSGGLAVPDSGSYTDVVEIDINAVRAGAIVIEGSMNADGDTGAKTSIRLRLYDVTAAASIIVSPSPGVDSHPTVRVTYEIPSGARTIKLQAQSFGDGSAINFATLTVEGIYTIP